MGKDKIVDCVCEVFNVSMDELSSKNRMRELLYPRIAIAYLMRDRLYLSNTKIGKILNRKHPTITYYINEVYPNEYKYNKAFRDKMMKIEKVLSERKGFIKGHKLKFVLRNEKQSV